MRGRLTMISALMRGSRNLRRLYSLVPYSSLLTAARCQYHFQTCPPRRQV